VIGPDVQVDPAAWVHPSAQLYGAVEVGAEASIWPNVVVRAESERVVIGPRTNVRTSP
jgi:carbonic anhydrase/acetyltransferase-like protein (isoleucine patch superfamily)